MTPSPSRPFVVHVVHGALDKLTRPPVLSMFALLHGVVMALLALSYLHGLEGPLSAERDRVVTGDYLAFLTAATILSQGQGGSLYDLDHQAEVQKRLAGITLDTWQPYVNPPLLAVLVRPLARLSYVHGFYLYSAVMTLAGLLGAFALVSLVPRLARGPLEAATLVLLCLGFHPIARTMFGGQNTVLTWALLCGALWALERGHEFAAGLLLGLLSYKPQYLPLLLAVLLFSRAWRALGAALFGLVVHYAVGAWAVGPDWPIRMLDAMRRYRPLEWAESVATHFSIVPFFDYAVGGTSAKIFAAIGIVAVLGSLIRYAPRARPGQDGFALLWAFALVGGMLVSPHLQYYDFGVLVLPVALGLDALLGTGRAPTLFLRLVLAAIYVGYPWFYMASDTLRFQPLTLWTIALFVWLGWLSTLARLGTSSARFARRSTLP